MLYHAACNLLLSPETSCVDSGSFWEHGIFRCPSFSPMQRCRSEKLQRELLDMASFLGLFKICRPTDCHWERKVTLRVPLLRFSIPGGELREIGQPLHPLVAGGNVSSSDLQLGGWLSGATARRNPAPRKREEPAFS